MLILLLISSIAIILVFKSSGGRKTKYKDRFERKKSLKRFKESNNGKK
jgi:hypothetical protein